MKQAFQNVSPCSSNNAIDPLLNRMYSSRSLMLKIILVVVVLATTAGSVLADPRNLTISESHVQPGESFTVTVHSTPGTNITLTLAGSRGRSIDYLLIMPDSGLIEKNITIPSTTLPDVYDIFVNQGNDTIVAGSVVVSPMMPREVMQNMLQSLEVLKNRLEVYIAEREAAGEKVLPEIMESYELAIEYLNQARLQCDNGQIKDASELLNMAQREFQKAYMLTINPEKPQDEVKIRVKTALLRAEVELNRVNVTLQSINRLGIDIVSQKLTLMQTREYLRDARNALEAGDATQAAELMMTVKQELIELQANSSQRIKVVKTRLAERYLNQVQNRAETLLQIVTEYQLRLNQTDRIRIINKLQSTNQKLIQIRSDLQSGVLDMEALQRVGDDIKSTIGMIRDKQIRLSLYQIDELESQILVLKTKANNQEGELGQQLLNEMQIKMRLLENIKEQLQVSSGPDNTQGSESGTNKPSNNSSSSLDQKPNNIG
jgi:hypothetical protein